MSTKSKVKMTRASATGNTFLITSDVPSVARSKWAKKVCQGVVGFNTDGFIILENSNQADLKWDFYNADGSLAEMCGNGIRCASLYYHFKNPNKKQISIETVAGIVHTEILDKNMVKTEMPLVKDIRKMKVSVGEKNITGVFLNTGVPHFVLAGQPVLELAKKLRSAKDFGSAGANITFIEELSPGEIMAVTFERGVEDFTLSCGTGAVAAAVAHLLENLEIKICHVEMPGGALLVTWQEGQRPFLQGQAQLEFDLQMYED